MGAYGLPPPGGIVVGVDDGSSAHGAVIWAARAARARRLPLVVCHAYRPSDARTDLELEGAARNRAWRTAKYAVETAEAEVPGVRAVPMVGVGPASQLLVDAVKRPDMIVVGLRRQGRLAAELLATFCGWAGSLEPCPVVAVPARAGMSRLSAGPRSQLGDHRMTGAGRTNGNRHRTGRIVVATAAMTSTSSDQTEILRFATAEAALWNSRVVEVPEPAFDISARHPGDPLSTLARDADLLVVGKPVDSAPEPLRSPPMRPGDDLEAPPAVSLGAALGYGAFRRLTTPVAVVPVVRRPALAALAGLDPTG